VRQVADVGPLALDDFLVVGDESVQLARQRFQLGRIFARDAAGLAGAYAGDLALQLKQGPKAHAHLQYDARDQHRQQHQQREGD